LIGHKDQSVLVEWIVEGMYHRAYVPLGKLKDGTVAEKDLERGIPYGEPWEKWIEITATPKSVANELRRHGMWRWQDVNNAALEAANKAFDRGAFLRQVNQEVKK
jgi:hypothetical protein